MKPAILQIGRMQDWDRSLIDQHFERTSIEKPLDIQMLALEQRQEFRACCYLGHAPFGEAELVLLPSLELIANFGVGYDAIDVAAASNRNIKVTNTPDVLTEDVADLALALFLALERDLVRADGFVRAGLWGKEPGFGLRRSASCRRVGILGLGRIGQSIARRLEALGSQIGYWSRSEKSEVAGYRYFSTPKALAEWSDAFFVSTVGGPETQGLVSGDVIEALGSEAVLINIARGSVIEEQALLEALETRRLAGAGLDVFASEPDLNRKFATLENTILTPHIGSATIPARQAMGQLMMDNVLAHFAGRPLPTPVN